MIVLQESIERKKKELKKAREDKEVVIDLLFNAFEQHQYYTFKDLCEITQQPDVKAYLIPLMLLYLSLPNTTI
jgi:NADH:ubiquinone oxidoreductase subunit E